MSDLEPGTVGAQKGAVDSGGIAIGLGLRQQRRVRFGSRMPGPAP